MLTLMKRVTGWPELCVEELFKGRLRPIKRK
jgi:hypothetical protein